MGKRKRVHILDSSLLIPPPPISPPPTPPPPPLFTHTQPKLHHVLLSQRRYFRSRSACQLYFLSGKRSGILILWKSWMHFSSSSSTVSFSLGGRFLQVLVSRELPVSVRSRSLLRRCSDCCCTRVTGPFLGGAVQGLAVGVGVGVRRAGDRAANHRALRGAGLRLALRAGGGDVVEGGTALTLALTLMVLAAAVAGRGRTIETGHLETHTHAHMGQRGGAHECVCVCTCRHACVYVSEREGERMCVCVCV